MHSTRVGCTRQLSSALVPTDRCQALARTGDEADLSACATLRGTIPRLGRLGCASLTVPAPQAALESDHSGFATPSEHEGSTQCRGRHQLAAALARVGRPALSSPEHSCRVDGSGAMNSPCLGVGRRHHVSPLYLRPIYESPANLGIGCFQLPPMVTPFAAAQHRPGIAPVPIAR